MSHVVSGVLRAVLRRRVTFPLLPALLAGLVVCLALPAIAQAETYTFDGGPSGIGTDWYTAENWDPDYAPNLVPGEQLVVPSGFTPIATVNAIIGNGNGSEWVPGSLTINGGDVTWSGRFNGIGNATYGHGTLIVNSGSLTVNYSGGLSHAFNIGNGLNCFGHVVQVGGTVTASNSNASVYFGASANPSSTGIYDISGGTLQAGNLIATNIAEFNYTGADAVVNLDVNYSFGKATATTNFLLDGSSRTIISAGNAVVLDNSTVTIAADPLASDLLAGTTYTLFQAGTGSLSAPATLIYDPASWSVTTTEGSGGSITATYVPEPSTSALLAAGLLGLLGCARRKRK